MSLTVITDLIIAKNYVLNEKDEMSRTNVSSDQLYLRETFRLRDFTITCHFMHFQRLFLINTPFKKWFFSYLLVTFSLLPNYFYAVQYLISVPKTKFEESEKSWLTLNLCTSTSDVQCKICKFFIKKLHKISKHKITSIR